MKNWIAALAVLFLATTAQAACLDVSKAENIVSLYGKLASATVAGPPNYEDVAQGDAAEVIYILQLAKSICIEDGGEFADPRENFDQVHVYSLNGLMLKMLKRKSGKDVRIEGNGFAAHTIHHRRPLVVSVTAVK
ncbi:MAG: DUF4431 domain-containing protein [Aestuariivirga sp.]